MIIAGRQTDPGLREPLAALCRRRAASRSSPSPPRSCAWARTTAHTWSAAYDSLLRSGIFDDEPPDLVLRFGEMPTSKPLRAWLAGSGADQLVVDPTGGWNEPTRRAAAILRVDPAALAAGLAERVERGSSEWVEPLDRGRVESPSRA